MEKNYKYQQPKYFRGNGSLELKYLLGQTYPYHYLKQHPSSFYYAKELAFDKDKKPWGTAQDATALLMLALQCRILVMSEASKSTPLILSDSSIQPVFHEDGRSMDD